LCTIICSKKVFFNLAKCKKVFYAKKQIIFSIQDVCLMGGTRVLTWILYSMCISIVIGTLFAKSTKTVLSLQNLQNPWWYYKIVYKWYMKVRLTRLNENVADSVLRSFIVGSCIYHLPASPILLIQNSQHANINTFICR
jgi:hypothetical protein